MGLVLSTLVIHGLIVSKSSVFYTKLRHLSISVYIFLSQKWHFDQISTELWAFNFMGFGYRNSFQLIDKGNIELFGPSGFSFNALASSKNVTGLQSGIITNYTLTLTIAALAILSFCNLLHLGLFSVSLKSHLSLILFYLLLFGLFGLVGNTPKERP